jgi:hypothetical protein
MHTKEDLFYYLDKKFRHEFISSFINKEIEKGKGYRWYVKSNREKEVI